MGKSLRSCLTSFQRYTGFGISSGGRRTKQRKRNLKTLWHESVPFTWWTVAVLVTVHAWWVIAALDGTSGVRVAVGQWWGAGCWAQEPVQTATTVLKCGSLFFLSKYFNAHWLINSRVHKGLTEADSLVPRHRLIAKETIEGEMCQYHIHGLWAQEAVVVGLQVVAPALNLYVRVEIGDDATPDVGGPERLPSHVLFWWRRRGDNQWLVKGVRAGKRAEVEVINS